jgi:hypothetical protein
LISPVADRDSSVIAGCREAVASCDRGSPSTTAPFRLLRQATTSSGAVDPIDAAEGEPVDKDAIDGARLAAEAFPSAPSPARHKSSNVFQTRDILTADDLVLFSQ